MVTLQKGNDTKILSEGSSLVDILLKSGWTIKTPKKEVKNGKSSNVGD